MVPVTKNITLKNTILFSSNAPNIPFNPPPPPPPVFRIPPTYESIADSGLFAGVVQEYWDFFHFGVNTVLASDTSQVTIGSATIAADPYTVCVLLSVPDINAFTQVVKPISRQTLIDVWQTNAEGGTGVGIAINRESTTGWSVGNAGQTTGIFAFNDQVYAIHSVTSGTLRRRTTGVAQTSTGGVSYNANKAFLGGRSPFPPGGGAFPNLVTGDLRLGHAGVTQAWHYWNRAFISAEIDELAEWIEDGNPII